MKRLSIPWLLVSLLIVLSLLVAGHAHPVALAQDGGQNPPPPSYKLNVENLRHVYQGWNNCGPATMTMGLSYFGYDQPQDPAARFMKPHREDKNVNPWEMTAYVNEAVSEQMGVQALYRPAGDMQLLKTLLANEFPVIVEKGYEPSGYDWMGHYLLLIGYDDTQQVFYTYDSFLGHGNFQGLTEDYATVEHYWWHFNNLFIVLYAPEREDELLSLLGSRAEMETAYQLAFNIAQERAAENTSDSWAWFNAGDALTHLSYYDQATPFFDVAFDHGLPWRTLWYRHTPFEAFYQSGDFQTVLQLVTQSKQTTPYVEEFHYYHGLVFASQGREADARAQFRQALTYNNGHQPTLDALAALDDGSFEPVTAAQ